MCSLELYCHLGTGFKSVATTVPVARFEEECNRVLMGKPEGERDHKEDFHVGGRVILRWILEKYDGVVWAGLMWLSIGTSGGLL
jgi:hypothetical protein